MVHELVHTAWDWVAAQFELTLAGYVGKLVVIGLLAIAVGAAALLFYVVEEPARRWMRRMVEIGESRTAPQIDADAEPVQGKLRSIDGAVEDRPKPAAARAM
jgi:peptidoglycan/LPS O-acetylase OafA/YrhL